MPHQVDAALDDDRMPERRVSAQDLGSCEGRVVEDDLRFGTNDHLEVAGIGLHRQDVRVP